LDVRFLRDAGLVLLSAWGATGLFAPRRYAVTERLGPWLGHGRRLPRTLVNGCRIECDLGEHLQRHVYFWGLSEPVEAWLFLRLLHPAMTVVDGGANIGEYTLLASTAVGDTGAVHAFEPIPDNFTRLRGHVAVNSLHNVRMRQAALWDRTTTLTLGRQAGRPSHAGAWSAAAPSGTVESVQAVSLDDYVAEEGIARVDALKLDIEGAEPNAVQGMLRTLERDRPLLLVELHETARALSTAAAVMALVAPLGYRLWRIDKEDPARCGPVEDIAAMAPANVLLHAKDLPAGLTDWTPKAVRRWARSGVSWRG
jgi:FkbM family methyltransferase